MRAVRVFLSRGLDLVLGRWRDERLSLELQAHLEMLEEDLMAQGLDRAEARRAARRRFGSVDRVTAEYRDQRGLPLIDTVWQDAQFAVRVLERDRSFTMTALLVLALGIGVNNMLFTILYSHTMRGLPIPGADRVAYLTTVDDRSPDAGMSFGEFEEVRRAAESFAGVTAFTNGPAVISGDGHLPDRVEASFVSGNAFTVLRVDPLLGRALEPQDDEPGRPAIIVLGDDLWRSRYGADPSVLGRPVRVNGVMATIAGVVPDRSGFPSTAQIWLPLSFAPALSGRELGSRALRAVGRLRDDIPLSAARAEIEAAFVRLSHEHPETNAHVRPRVIPINERFMGRRSEPTWLAFMAVGLLVVLISSLNVANLMLARGSGRAREIAIRTSLGASRGRVIRQLLIEGSLLAVLSGAVGLALAVIGVRLFRNAIPQNALPYWIHYSIDTRILAALIGVSVGTVFIFALLPAFKASAIDVNRVLKTGGRGGSRARGAQRWMTGFLAAEFALAVVLLAPLSVAVRTSQPGLRSDAIIDTPRVVTAGISLPSEAYGHPDSQVAFYRALDDRLRSVRGISAASVASAVPVSGGAQRQVELIDRDTGTRASMPVLTNAVGPRYFETLGLPMVHGREFLREDAGRAERVAVVNERFAARFFAGVDPIGHRLGFSPAADPTAEPQWSTIVGIAPDLGQRPGQSADAIVYLPFDEAPAATAFVLVRGAGAAEHITSALREQVHALDPGLAVFRVRTMRELLRETNWPGRISAAMFLALTGIAVGLAVVGLYGVAAYDVTRRTHEIGVRVALGARPMSVARLIARTALLRVAIGFVAGLGCTVVWDHLFPTGQAGVRFTDPQSLALIASTLLACACVACVVPAVRAARVDPLTAIRHE